jgi:hypothetical protein
VDVVHLVDDKSIHDKRELGVDKSKGHGGNEEGDGTSDVPSLDADGGAGNDNK